jgi:hypothetical protein
MAKKTFSDADALHHMGRIASEVMKKNASIAEPTGACAYTTNSGATYCAVLTKSYCDELHGTWTQGKDCP